MFLELMAMYECYLPVAQKFAIPVIGTISMRSWYDVDLKLGNPHPLVFPFLLGSYPVRMSFYQRLQNVFQHIYMSYLIQHLTIPKLQEFYQTHFPGYDLNENKEISFLFTNTHWSTFPKAIAPTTAEIGGVHIKPLKPLPKVSSPKKIF